MVSMDSILVHNQYVNGSNVSFGSNTNQLNHTFRHVESMGLNRDTIKNAVTKDLAKKDISKLEIGKPHNIILEVDGHKIQYTLFRRSENDINIGRIHGAE